MPQSTRLLAIAAAVLSVLWAWAWLGLDWTLAIPADPQHPVMTTPPSPLQANAAAQARSPVDSASILGQPAFYPDRRMHPYRPDAEGEAVAPTTTLDFELTTTVVTARRAFAVLRLRGGGTSVIARPGEPFEADPAWQVTRIDRTSATFVNAQGTPLTLTIKPPAPATRAIAAAPIVASTTPARTPSVPIASTAQPAPVPAQAPVTAVQPMQENAEVRARIEARRREAEARTPSARTQ